MIEKEIYAVREYKFDDPIITEIDSILDECLRDCHICFFHNFKYECIYDIKLTNITNNEIFNLTISDKCMNLYELNEKLTVARQNGFIFIQMNKLTIKFYSQLRYINISYYLKSQILMCHRQFFRVISRNRDYVENFCNNVEKPFRFACQKRINQLN